MTPPPEFFRVVRHIKIQMEYIPTNKENEKNIIINGGGQTSSVGKSFYLHT
jgi:hypothetical protein